MRKPLFIIVALCLAVSYSAQTKVEFQLKKAKATDEKPVVVTETVESAKPVLGVVDASTDTAEAPPIPIIDGQWCLEKASDADSGEERYSPTLISGLTLDVETTRSNRELGSFTLKQNGVTSTGLYDFNGEVLLLYRLPTGENMGRKILHEFHFVATEKDWLRLQLRKSSGTLNMDFGGCK